MFIISRPYRDKVGLCALLGLWLWVCCPVPAMAERPLVLGVHPYLAATELRARFEPLADYLGKRLGRSIRVRVAPDYRTHLDAVGRNRVDLAYLGPAGYVQVVQRYGPRPLLGRLEVAGRPVFHGMVVTRRDSPLGRMEDLAGRRFAFGDPMSTMSHVVPRYMLWKAGVGVEDLGGYAFLGRHDNVALGVLFGDFDAGGVKEETYEKYKSRGLRTLATSPPIPEHLLVARSDADRAWVVRLRDLLLGMHREAEGLAALQRIKRTVTALVPVEDSDYDGLREILASLREVGVQP
jgi:phosphonate transport system substrate-binding protein